MAEQIRCPQCGGPCRADVALGICPRCLLQRAMEPGQTSGAAMANADATLHRPSFVSPTLVEIAPHFPQFEFLGVIGQGGMGVVYKARHPRLDRLVALKLLQESADRGPSFAERFCREARALAKLAHPGIVTVYDFGESDGLYYLVMEYVDGVNLRQVLHAGCLQPAEALRLVPQICAALQYAHDQGVVHRDIKPENILLDRQGQVKIADFGLAKVLRHPGDSLALTGSGQVMGTPHYMAPEQIERPLLVDHRADIYALGVVFYEMLTGELPLGRFAPPSCRRPVDHRIDPIVLRALEKEPAERYQQARDVTTDIESLTPRRTDAPPTVVEERRPDDWATVKASAATALAVWRRLYARLIGNDPPGSAWPARSSSRWVQWPILIVIGWLYVVSFFLPAAVVQGTITNPLPARPLEPITLRGVSCFDWGWTLLRPSWFANPVLWVACALLAFRFWRWAGFIAQIALLLALTELLHDRLTDYLVGFWLWSGSMGMLAVCAFYAWWTFRRPVFRHPETHPSLMEGGKTFPRC